MDDELLVLKAKDGEMLYSKAKLIKYSNTIDGMVIDSLEHTHSSAILKWVTKKMMNDMILFIEMFEKDDGAPMITTEECLNKPLPDEYNTLIKSILGDDGPEGFGDTETLLLDLKCADYLEIDKVKVCIFKYLDVLTRGKGENEIKKICASTLI